MTDAHFARVDAGFADVSRAMRRSNAKFARLAAMLSVTLALIGATLGMSIALLILTRGA